MSVASLILWALILIISVVEERPRIPDEERADVIEITAGITRILHCGFMQYSTIYAGLTLACKQGKLPGIDLADTTYCAGRETIIPRDALFDVPARQVVEFGTETEI
ncbi:MAG: hypothetical protein JO141_31680 [Bradyrhizobium sp.]|nr:hypothetical protein [Bradyrhizobium sp.]